MLKCLKTNVAKTEQDALTTTGGSYCLIVCGSHKNACSGRVFLSHRLRKIICFMGKQHRETERYSLEGRRSQRALFAHNCCDALVRELGVSTGPPGRLWGWRPKKPSGSQEDIIRHRVCARTWLQLGRKQAAADRVSQGGRTDRCRKLLPENACLLSAIHTKWSCCITSPLRCRRFLLFT